MRIGPPFQLSLSLSDHHASLQLGVQNTLVLLFLRRPSLLTLSPSPALAHTHARTNIGTFSAENETRRGKEGKANATGGDKSEIGTLSLYLVQCMLGKQSLGD